MESFSWFLSHATLTRLVSCWRCFVSVVYNECAAVLQLWRAAGGAAQESVSVSQSGAREAQTRRRWAAWRKRWRYTQIKLVEFIRFILILFKPILKLCISKKWWMEFNIFITNYIKWIQFFILKIEIIRLYTKCRIKKNSLNIRILQISNWKI